MHWLDALPLSTHGIIGVMFRDYQAKEHHTSHTLEIWVWGMCGAHAAVRQAQAPHWDSTALLHCCAGRYPLRFGFCMVTIVTLARQILSHVRLEHSQSISQSQDIYEVLRSLQSSCSAHIALAQWSQCVLFDQPFDIAGRLPVCCTAGCAAAAAWLCSTPARNELSSYTL
jgi:hypothetical protein